MNKEHITSFCSRIQFYPSISLEKSLRFYCSPSQDGVIWRGLVYSLSLTVSCHYAFCAPSRLLQIRSPCMRTMNSVSLSLSHDEELCPSELGETSLRPPNSISPSHETFPHSRVAHVLEPRHRNSDRLHVRMADTDIRTLGTRLLRCGLGIAVQLNVSSA